MKNVSLLFLLIFVFASLTLSSQQISKLVNYSNDIIYGSVIEKSYHWNEEQTAIYTENRVNIIDIFKGEFRDSIIPIITPGGIVDDFFQF